MLGNTLPLSGFQGKEPAARCCQKPSATPGSEFQFTSPSPGKKACKQTQKGPTVILRLGFGSLRAFSLSVILNPLPQWMNTQAGINRLSISLLFRRKHVSEKQNVRFEAKVHVLVKRENVFSISKHNMIAAVQKEHQL